MTAKLCTILVLCNFALFLKGDLNFVWISIGQSVIVSGIVYVFMRSVAHDWSGADQFTNYGGIDNYRMFNYLSYFAENWLKGVYMCQDDTCKIISQSDHPFNSKDQKFKFSIYVYHWMRLIRFHMKILTASGTESDYVIRCTWVMSIHLYG